MRVLVVGQGLAGTLASHAALDKGWDVHVIDAGLPSASAVAAGMYNPMSFRRIVEVWDAQLHLDAMRRTYRDLENLLGASLMHALPIRKRMPNADYARDWNRQATVLPWIRPVQTDSCGRPYGQVDGGGWLDLPLLLIEWRKWLMSQRRFQILNWAAETVEDPWDAIIDCRGVHSRTDSHLGDIDVRANRGEILTVKATATAPLPSDVIDNFGKWTLPIAPSTWRLGASYEWNRTDLDPTVQTREFLVESLQAAHPNDILGIQVVAHEAGLRPVSRDRRPAVGPREGRKRHFIFNGLGTRGVLIGPRWAKHLVDGITGEAPWDPIVSPARLELPS